MMLNMADRKNYLRGLLILTGDVKQVSASESKKINEVCRLLELNQDFVKSVIDEFANEHYVIENPPKFINHQLAEVFLKDGIRMAFIKKALHLYKLHWLLNFAVMNDFSKQWFYIELEYYLDNSSEYFKNTLEIQKYIEKNSVISGTSGREGYEVNSAGTWN